MTAPARIASSSYHRILPVITALQLVVFLSAAPIASAKEPFSRIYSDKFAPTDFLTLTNEAREAQGLSDLSLNTELDQAAAAKAEDMATKGYWDHFRPSDHKAPWAFIEEAGYNYKVAGENLARGFKTPNGITKAWMASPTHRANLLSPKYTEVGFASIETIDSSGNTVLLTVQMFGSR